MLIPTGTSGPPIASATGSAVSLASNIVIRTLDNLQQHVTNQIDEFTSHQAYLQRILAISSSCASIAACLVAIYMFLAIDPRRLIFRHQLITFLLLFDFIKAIILLLYPSRVITHSTSYFDSHFCQVVGFFTAMSIEGADIAILAFAVHTYLLIFKPGLTTKVKNSTRLEGGLYKYRYYVYVLSFIIPVFMASLAFIGVGYISLVCWCYLPQQPVWSRLVLSWVPRYLIVIAIFVIYGLIYFHVIREFKTLGGVFTTIHKSHQTQLHPYVSSDEKPSFFSALKFSLISLRDRTFPKFVLPDQNPAMSPSQSRKPAKKQKTEEDDDDDDEENHSDFSTPVHVDTENIIYDPEIHAANLAKFRKRQKIIEKQMKSIFIYPFAYCFIWIFPFMLQATQFNHERRHGPIYWLNLMGAFMQPLSGFVDSMVFFYREQPWKYTIKRNFEKEHMSKMDNLITTTHPHHASQDRRQSRNSAHDSESIATSAVLTKNSLSASTGLIDFKHYSSWRQWLSWFRLPLFILPNDENMGKFQLDYITKKLTDINNNPNGPTTNQSNALNFGSSDDSSKDFNEKLKSFGAGVNKYDFSDLLKGDLAEKDFRHKLEKFSFNFHHGDSSLALPATAHHSTSQHSSHNKRLSSSVNSTNSSHHKNSIISMGRSSKSRQVSNIEPTSDPILFEGKKTSYSSNKRSFNSQPISNGPKRGQSAGLNSHTSVSSRSAVGGEEDDEMDFMDFLKNGP